MPSQRPTRTIVLIGTGSMGLACARRLGPGHHLILADYSEIVLSTAQTTMQEAGYDVSAHPVDISSLASVQTLAEAAQSKGNISAILLTAGVSPTIASAKQIYEIDLLGTANVIEAFLPVAGLGTSLVCISSMAGHFASLSPTLQKHLATAPLSNLLSHPELDLNPEVVGMAYATAKRGNQLRVQAAAYEYGLKGARINSVSPGVTATALGMKELETGGARSMVEGSAMGRLGTVDDIAEAVRFLVGAAFVTGTDLLVDGGAVAAKKWPSNSS